MTDTKKAADLAACPFCGETDTYLTSNGIENDFVGCACGAEGPTCGTPEEAIAAWNRRSALPSPAGAVQVPQLKADDVEWIVNDNAELGVKIGNQVFFLYKGQSLVYESGKHDDGTPMLYRMVGKREFGECCHPVKFYKEGARLPERYTEDLVYTPGLSFGAPEDGAWRALPAAPTQGDSK